MPPMRAAIDAVVRTADLPGMGSTSPAESSSIDLVRRGEITHALVLATMCQAAVRGLLP